MIDTNFLNNLKEDIFMIMYNIGCFDLETLKQMNIIFNNIKKCIN